MQVISTHTLTWSVTTAGRPDRTERGNFNSHAHVERDLMKYKAVAAAVNFNSHAHVERDPAALMHDCGDIQISTHTLTWSVTSKLCVISNPL